MPTTALGDEAVTAQSFYSLPAAIHSQDPNTLLVGTHDGWYCGDLRDNRWWQFLDLEYGEGHPEVHYVGSGQNFAYFLEELRGEPTRLVRCRQQSQKRMVLEEGATHAAFVDDAFGVIYDEERGMQFTRDGGKKWLALPARPDFPLKRIRSLTPIGRDAVVAIQSGGTGHVWYQPLPAPNNDEMPEGWSVRMPIAPSGVLGVKDGCVWFSGSDLVGLNLEDGAVRYRLPVHHKSIRVLMNKDWTLILYPNRVEAVRLAGDEWETVFVHRLPYLVHDADLHTDQQGRSYLAIVEDEGRLAFWGPLDERAEPEYEVKTMHFENGAEVEEPQKAARLKKGIGELSKKMRRVVELSKQIPDEQREAIDHQATQLEDLEATQKIDWLIAEYEKYLKANPPEEKD